MAFEITNTILEINESHTDNFILVIPYLPTAEFISSSFNFITTPNPVNPTNNEVQDQDCEKINEKNYFKKQEGNLDLTNFLLYISDVTLPGTTISTYEMGSHFATINRASKIQFSDLETNMMVSENLLNYNIILFWLYALHNPEYYNKISGRDMIKNFFIDIYLIITDNHRNKVSEYRFIDAFPSSLPALNMTNKNANKLYTNVTWKHSGMTPSDNFVLKYV